jgi:hypothetical protein
MPPGRIAPRVSELPTSDRLADKILAAERRGAVSKGELAELRAQAAELERERDDARLSALEARAAEQRARVPVLQVSEPTTYSVDSPHSWFLDMYRHKRGQRGEVLERLEAHGREMAALAPGRAKDRNRRAARAAEQALTATPGERRALDAFTGAGGVIFERRAMTRVDGQGGYFVPPAWLIDRAVPPPRADAALAGVVTTLPLPEYCDSVNLPRVTTGTAAAVQAGDTAPAAKRDLADAFVSGNVITVAGIVDISMQWFDQGSGGAGGALDALVWDDLQADVMLQLDGNLILGSGVNGQGLGLLPPQTAVSTSLAVYAPNGNTTAGQAVWYNGGSGTALGVTIAQCISGVTRARAKRPTHLLAHPFYFDLLTSQTDQQGRPYVPPKGPHPVPPGADLPPGVVGYSHGLPVLGDLNVPTTQGGTASPPQQPYLGTLNGIQYAGQPGTGAAALYTPVMPIVADDLFVFLDEPRMHLMSDVTSGSLEYRFQLRQYAVIIPNRYQAVAAGTLANSGGWTVGAISSYGIVQQQGSGSLLSITGQGF